MMTSIAQEQYLDRSVIRLLGMGFQRKQYEKTSQGSKDYPRYQNRSEHKRCFRKAVGVEVTVRNG
jgi:hypothetical protein